MSNNACGSPQLIDESIKDWSHKVIKKDLVLKVDNNKVLTLLYKNWKGNTSIRRVQPIGNMYWGTTEYHKEPQWLFDVWDLDKDAPRTYAFKDIIQVLNNDQ